MENEIKNMQDDALDIGSKKNKWPILVILLVVAALAAALYLGFFVQNQTSPEDVAIEFFQLASSEQYNEAYDLTHSDFKESANVEGLEVFVESYQVLDNMTSIDFSYSETMGDLYLISGRVQGAGEELPITVQFLKENGEWKIVFFSTNEDDVSVVE